MCEKCAVTEGTFRRILYHVLATGYNIDDIVYVVRAGDCDVYPYSGGRPYPLPTMPDHAWASEVLTQNGLKYPLAKWVLSNTSPISNPGGQNV